MNLFSLKANRKKNLQRGIYIHRISTGDLLISLDSDILILMLMVLFVSPSLVNASLPSPASSYQLSAPCLYLSIWLIVFLVWGEGLLIYSNGFINEVASCFVPQTRIEEEEFEFC